MCNCAVCPTNQRSATIAPKCRMWLSQYEMKRNQFKFSMKTTIMNREWNIVNDHVYILLLSARITFDNLSVKCYWTLFHKFLQFCNEHRGKNESQREKEATTRIHKYGQRCTVSLRRYKGKNHFNCVKDEYWTHKHQTISKITWTPKTEMKYKRSSIICESRISHLVYSKIIEVHKTRNTLFTFSPLIEWYAFAILKTTKLIVASLAVAAAIVFGIFSTAHLFSLPNNTK